MKKLSMLLVISSLALVSSNLFADDMYGPQNKPFGPENRPQRRGEWKADKRQKMEGFINSIDKVLADPDTPEGLKKELTEKKEHVKARLERAGKRMGKMHRKMQHNRAERMQKMQSLIKQVDEASMNAKNDSTKANLNDLGKRLKDMQSKMERRGKRMERRGERRMERRGDRMQRMRGDL